MEEGEEGNPNTPHKDATNLEIVDFEVGPRADRGSDGV